MSLAQSSSLPLAQNAADLAADLAPPAANGTAPPPPRLTATHWHMLTVESAIAPEVIAERGYFTAETSADVEALGFADYQAATAPALVLPAWDVHGARHVAPQGWQLRPEAPRRVRAGKHKGEPIKYESATGSQHVLDCHPRGQPLLADPAVRLWITEGIKKGDALTSQGCCALALQGVDSWQRKNVDGQSEPLTDWQAVVLKGRHVAIVYDSDVILKKEVAGALRRLTKFLRARHALPVHVVWPEAFQQQKVGVDDFFAAGHTLAELEALLPEAAAPSAAGSQAAGPPHPSDPAASLGTVSPCTQGANAQRIQREWKEKLHYTTGAGWMFWTGAYWRIDSTRDDALTTGLVHTLPQMIAAEAQELTRIALTSATNQEQKDVLRLASERLQWAIRSDNAAALHGALTMAKAGLLIRNEQFDAQPWLFNCQNGTLNLQTGALTPHEPTDLLTRCAPVVFNKDATCPRWRTFVGEVFAGDQDMVRFLQRAIGWSLTGVVQERALFFLYGPSGYNGKTTVVETIKELLGSCGEEEVGYARKVDVSTFMRSKNLEENQRKMAALVGPRFVYTSEVDEAHRLNEQLIKDITGGDTVDARRLYHETFSFKPTFKAWMYGNYKPDIRGTDEAIWGRVKLIPFEVSFKDRMDLTLGNTLKGELSGILNWALEGCREWQKHGLRPPQKVQEATAAYRIEQDVFAPFIAERCDVLPAARIKTSHLWTAYKRWCAHNDQEEQSQTRFGNYLTAKGFLSDGNKSGHGAIRSGLNLKQEPEPPDAWDAPDLAPAASLAPPSATPLPATGSSLNASNDAAKSTLQVDMLPLATPFSRESCKKVVSRGSLEKGVARGSIEGNNNPLTLVNTCDAPATPLPATGSKGVATGAVESHPSAALQVGDVVCLFSADGVQALAESVCIARIEPGPDGQPHALFHGRVGGWPLAQCEKVAAPSSVVSPVSASALAGSPMDAPPQFCPGCGVGNDPKARTTWLIRATYWECCKKGCGHRILKAVQP